MKKLFLLPSTVLAFAIAAEANADLASSSQSGGEWYLDNYSGFPTDTMARVNGNVLYSDKLRAKFPQGRCEKGLMFTTDYLQST